MEYKREIYTNNGLVPHHKEIQTITVLKHGNFSAVHLIDSTEMENADVGGKFGMEDKAHTKMRTLYGNQSTKFNQPDMEFRNLCTIKAIKFQRDKNRDYESYCCGFWNGE